MSFTCEYPVVAAPKRATLHVVGHCEYLNCAPLRKFLDFALSSENYEEIVLEFGECASMDSTALGLIARSALLLKKNSARRLVLVNLRNGPLRAAMQLGLDHIVRFENRAELRRPELRDCAKAPAADARLDRKAIRDAHEALIEIEPKNSALFADVVSFIGNMRASAAAMA